MFFSWYGYLINPKTISLVIADIEYKSAVIYTTHQFEYRVPIDGEPGLMELKSRINNALRGR